MKKFWVSILAGSFISSLISGCASTPTVQHELERDWILTHAEVAEHSISSNELASNYTLNINLDGSINGLNACNRWHSTYKIESEKLSIGPVASTKKRCNLSSDNLTLITRKFPSALSTPATIHLGQDTLTLSWSDKEYFKFKLKD